MMSPMNKMTFFSYICRRCVCYALLKNTMTLTFVLTILFKNGKSVSINLLNRTLFYRYLSVSLPIISFQSMKTVLRTN